MDAGLSPMRQATRMVEEVATTCRAEEALALVQGKWKVPILGQLKVGPVRFGALRRGVSGISQKVLTSELKELIAAGVVTRTVRAEAPILNVQYELTPFGEEVEGLLRQLDDWSRHHLLIPSKP